VPEFNSYFLSDALSTFCWSVFWVTLLIVVIVFVGTIVNALCPPFAKIVDKFGQKYPFAVVWCIFIILGFFAEYACIAATYSGYVALTDPTLDHTGLRHLMQLSYFGFFAVLTVGLFVFGIIIILKILFLLKK